MSDTEFHADAAGAEVTLDLDKIVHIVLGPVELRTKPWGAATLARKLMTVAEASGTFGVCGGGVTGQGCGAPIFWAFDKDDRPRPLDIGDHPEGTAAVTNDGGKSRMRYLSKAHPFDPDSGEHRVMPHHATCPRRDQFRKRDADAPRAAASQ